MKNMQRYRSFFGGVLLRFKQSFLAVFLRIAYYKLVEAVIATKYMASYGMLSKSEKLRTHIDIKVHALEKGMSIGNGRVGFGKQKAFEVIADLSLYLKMGGDKVFANECCGIIKKYIEYNEISGADMADVRDVYDMFSKEYSIQPAYYGGIYELNHEELRKQQLAAFDIFSQCRYSCRDFGDEPISFKDLENALKLCERTPTACNRQSQRVHVYLNKNEKDKLCKMQGGCKGFYDNFQGAILICADITGYSSAETNLPFVDGGLYAMNLLYALNFYDIAAIPLTMGRRANELQHILKVMGIAKNEMPVLLIGIGSYKDRWKVAQSHRYDWRTYTTIYS